MKQLSTIVAFLMCCGCTSLKPVNVPADQIHERIAAEKSFTPEIV